VNVVLPVKNYGGGHQQLIEIAKALNKNARLLILDEPSASLTASEIAVLLEIIRGLKAKGVACVYISHKLEEVAAICDTIAVIRDGQHIATTPMAQMDVEPHHRPDGGARDEPALSRSRSTRWAR
jgi:D-xylose transport system ATP-binding protein